MRTLSEGAAVALFRGLDWAALEGDVLRIDRITSADRRSIRQDNILRIDRVARADRQVHLTGDCLVASVNTFTTGVQCLVRDTFAVGVWRTSQPPVIGKHKSGLLVGGEEPSSFEKRT